MATVVFPASTADWTWTTDGSTGEVTRTLPPSQAQWQWNTGGNPGVLRTLVSDPVTWQWNTTMTTDIVRKELLAGSGITAQVWDRDNWDDAANGLIALVQYESLKFEAELSGFGSFEMVLGAKYLGAEWLAQDNIIKFVVEGILRFSCIIEDFIEEPINEQEDPGVRVVGRGVGAVLEWGTVAPSNWPNAGYNTTRTWTLATRGAILSELLDEIHARNTMLQVTKDGWSNLVGSDGVVFTNFQDIERKAGGTYASLLNDWVDYGIEWYMGPSFGLQVGTHLGRDLSNSVVLYPLNTVRSQENTFIRRDIRTRLFVEDGNDGVDLIEDVVAISKWGRRELYQVFSEAAGLGTATSSGYALMELIKDQVIERRVKIDPFVDGRRPFVDFDIGDEVSVVFGTTKIKFRVLAIALSVNEDNLLVAEVTLDFILEAQRKRREKLIAGGGGGGGGNSGAQTVYAIGGNVVAGGSPLTVTNLVVNAFSVTYGKVGFTIIGTMSSAATVTVDILYGNTVLESFPFTMPAGAQTIEETWLWTTIPADEVGLSCRVSVSAGTFTVLDGKAQLWVEAKNIAGTQVNGPNIIVDEEVPGAQEVTSVGDSAILWLPELASGETLELSEAAPPTTSLHTITETVSDPPIFILQAQPLVSGDDGYLSAGTLTTNSTSTFAGNVSGTSRSAFYRFTIPVDLTGRTIIDAWLVATGNAASAAAVTKLYAIDEAAPAAPTTAGEFTGATLTTESRDWLTATTSGGVVTSPSIKNIIEELLASYGTITSLVMMHLDDGSASNNNNQFRSYDFGSTAGVKLVLQYQEV